MNQIKITTMFMVGLYSLSMIADNLALAQAEVLVTEHIISTDLTLEELEQLRLFGWSEITAATYSVIAAIDARIWLLKQTIKNTYPVVKPAQPVMVQESIELCAQEKNFIKNRMQRVQSTLQKEFNIHQPLRIAFCCSGGGNRAMIGTLGLLSGAAKSKVLDATLYVAGLSGSTWLLSPFCCLQSCGKMDNVTTLLELQKRFEKSLSNQNIMNFHGAYLPAALSLDTGETFVCDIAQRYAYGQPLTLVNLYGPFVAHYALELFGDARFSQTWSSFENMMQQGAAPLPLCSAAFQRKELSYGWFETTPFQAGSSDFGYVPVKYLGSAFKDGVLDENNICPEYPISFYLGVYGSAFAITLQEMEAHIQDYTKHEYWMSEQQTKGNFLLNLSFLQTKLQQLTDEILIGRDPFIYARFSHFGKAAKYKDTMLGLFDAGIDMNIPLPTILDRPERALDLIIIYDSNPGDATSVHQIYSYGLSHGIDIAPSMAHVTKAELNAKTMTIFNDPRITPYNVAAPTIVYFPTKDINVQTLPYVTINFKYLSEQVRALSQKMEQAFLSNIDEIKSVMKATSLQRHRA